MSDDTRDLTTGMAIAFCAALVLAMAAVYLRVGALHHHDVPKVRTDSFPYCVAVRDAFPACRVRP